MRNVLVVFGPQGSGKSSQVERLGAEFGFHVFEAGYQLRLKSEQDRDIHNQIKSGQLVPGSYLRSMVEEFIQPLAPSDGVIFDGYPRNEGQCQDFKALAEQYDWRPIVIYIHLSDESAKLRLANRYQIINGKRVFREDDKPAIVEKRLATFKTETLPIKDWLAEHYQTFEIDGEPDIDQVTASINQVLKPLLNA